MSPFRRHAASAVFLTTSPAVAADGLLLGLATYARHALTAVEGQPPVGHDADALSMADHRAVVADQHQSQPAVTP